MKNTLVSEILAHNRDNPLYLNIIGFVASCGQNLQLHTNGRDLACTYYSSIAAETTCCFATYDTDFVEQVLSTVSGEVCCCGINEQVYQYLQSTRNLSWSSDFGLYVHNGKPINNKLSYEILPMDKKYWQDIVQGVSYPVYREEIEECLDNRLSSAIYIDGKPVCWALLHKEYSLGMLYTVEQYRNRGLALQVISHLCNQVIAQGMTPYAYINKGNVASENLAPKYNLNYQCDVYWCGFAK